MTGGDDCKRIISLVNLWPIYSSFGLFLKLLLVECCRQAQQQGREWSVVPTKDAMKFRLTLQILDDIDD